MPSKIPQIDIAHLTQQQAASLLRVSSRALRDWNIPRNSDGSYNGADVVAWFVASKISQERAKSTMNEDRLMQSVADSPALERWREAKASHAELDLLARRGELVSVDVASKALAIVSARLQRMGARLTKRHGKDVADEIDATLIESESDLEAAFSNKEPSHG